MDIKQNLYWLMQMGISSFYSEKEKTSATPVSIKEEEPLTTQAQMQAAGVTTLAELNQIKMDFQLSSIRKTAAHSLLGRGPISPKLMCVLEMPDATADREGKTLAGEQIALLTKMMAAINLDIAKDVYVVYFSPWRTPGNRPLTKSEQALLLPLLEKEIQLIKPQKILLFGAGIASALLKTDSLAKARASWHYWDKIPTRVTLAPATLKTMALKKQAWADLQALQKGD